MDIYKKKVCELTSLLNKACPSGFPIDTTDCIHIQAPAGPVHDDYPNKPHGLNVLGEAASTTLTLSDTTLWSKMCCIINSTLCLQIICDDGCLISNTEEKWPDCVHDYRMFRGSSLAQRLVGGKR